MMLQDIRAIEIKAETLRWQRTETRVPTKIADNRTFVDSPDETDANIHGHHSNELFSFMVYSACDVMLSNAFVCDHQPLWQRVIHACCDTECIATIEIDGSSNSLTISLVDQTSEAPMPIA